MSVRRALLELLPRDELAAAADRHGLTVSDRRANAGFVDLLTKAGEVGLEDTAAGASWAVAVRDAVRGVVRTLDGPRVHLFISGPAGGALLLGHVWNRVGPTLVYEDLSPGYAPTFEIPG